MGTVICLRIHFRDGVGSRSQFQAFLHFARDRRRKRRTEAEHQLGPIVAVAREHGLSAPITERLVALVRDIEDGRRAQDWATLDLLMETVPA